MGLFNSSPFYKPEAGTWASLLWLLTLSPMAAMVYGSDFENSLWLLHSPRITNLPCNHPCHRSYGLGWCHQGFKHMWPGIWREFTGGAFWLPFWSLEPAAPTLTDDLLPSGASCLPASQQPYQRSHRRRLPACFRLDKRPELRE